MRYEQSIDLISMLNQIAVQLGRIADALENSAGGVIQDIEL